MFCIYLLLNHRFFLKRYRTECHQLGQGRMDDFTISSLYSEDFSDCETSRVSRWVHPSIVVPVPEHFISGSHCTIPGLESYRLLWSGGWDFLSNIPARTERAKPHRVTRSQRGDKTGKCGSTPRSWAWGTVARGRAVQARLWPEWRHLNTCLILGPSMPQSVVSTAVMNSQASLRKPTSSPLKTLRFNKCGYSIGGLGCQGQKLLKRKEREENQKVV